MAITIEFVGGPRDGETRTFSSDSITVGRVQDADLVFEDDNSVSREHARVIHESGQHLVQDAGSTHGTFVDGDRISEGVRRALQPGHPVRVGSCWFAIAQQ